MGNVVPDEDEDLWDMPALVDTSDSDSDSDDDIPTVNTYIPWMGSGMFYMPMLFSPTPLLMPLRLDHSSSRPLLQGRALGARFHLGGTPAV